MRPGRDQGFASERFVSGSGRARERGETQPNNPVGTSGIAKARVGPHCVSGRGSRQRRDEDGIAGAAAGVATSVEEAINGEMCRG